MALQELYSEYKPEGLVGGMVSGLNTGANLGSMFAQTNATNQQTSSREQKLPYEIAGLAAGNDRDVMANGLTRATQPSQIEATNATNQTAVMTQQQLQELMPFDTFNKQITMTYQQSAGMISKAADRLERGDKSVWQELKAMADQRGPEAQKAFQETYKQFGNLPPQQAAVKAREYVNKLLSTLDNLDPKTRLEMYKANLEHMEKMLAAQNSGRGDGKPTGKETEINNLARYYMQKYKIGEVEAKARATADLRGKVENTDLGGVSFPTKTNIGGPGFAPLGNSFEALSGGGTPTPKPVGKADPLGLR